MTMRTPALLALTAALALLSSCKTTLDSIGCGEPNRALDGGTGIDAGSALAALAGPGSYPNLFRDLLGKSDADISNKVAGVFDQLFHGDPSNQAIYIESGTDQAYIYDVFHDDIRSEGMGFGMLIAVELGKRDEFDKLWRYAKGKEVASGAAQGYFPSFCNTANSNADDPCYDPFGLQQIAMDLLLARGRWQASPGSIDYGAEAANLLDIIRNKAAYNCGVLDDITGTLDSKTKLPYDTPVPASANLSRPSIVLPAYYDLWARATGDSFWSQVAAAGRQYWQASANPKTGLFPLQATFAGTPVPGLDAFGSECDRALLAMTLDHLWSGTKGWLVDESNRLLQFFYAQGISSYGQSYSLDGQTELAPLHDMPLVAGNGMLALVATTGNRSDFVNEVWNLNTPTGSPRYYAGIMQLLALITLSGQMQVY